MIDGAIALIMALGQEMVGGGESHSLSGSLWLAAMLSVTAFTALHIPRLGYRVFVCLLLTGAVMTAFFIWKRDLLAMILAHVAIVPHLQHNHGSG